MPTYTNAARRVLATFDRIRNQPNQQERLSTYVAAWYGENAVDEASQIRRSYRYLERWLEEVEHLARVFAQQQGRVFESGPALITDLKAGIETALIGVRSAASSSLPRFTDAMRARLEMFADLLPDTDPCFTKAELRDLTQALSQLKTLASNPEVPAALRAALEEMIGMLEEAIRAYQIRGGRGFIDHVLVAYYALERAHRVMEASPSDDAKLKTAAQAVWRRVREMATRIAEAESVVSMLGRVGGLLSRSAE